MSEEIFVNYFCNRIEFSSSPKASIHVQAFFKKEIVDAETNYEDGRKFDFIYTHYQWSVLLKVLFKIWIKIKQRNKRKDLEVL
ncbi:hypothetical protein TNIN_67751 [Trichonephila inaurata madagascariensis]|uniref:Uncharacterized protein n=1 Tax=Trichonephila inaurata madagascariensis TaxID=2747483 RepID=A0A8X6K4Z0_9ARAC|nr:hypothetical protein TNIN_67751 [Trichonephila inaurata madagascariensis]